MRQEGLAMLSRAVAAAVLVLAFWFEGGAFHALGAEIATSEDRAKTAGIEEETSADTRTVAALLRLANADAMRRVRAMADPTRGDYAVAMVQANVARGEMHSTFMWLEFISQELKHSPKHVAIAQSFRGALLQRGRQFSSSLEQTAAALNTFYRLKEWGWYERVLIKHADTLHMAGRLPESAKAFSQLAVLARHRKDELLAARYQLYSAMANYKAGQTDEAEAELSEAMPVFEQEGFKQGLAMVNKLRGNIAMTRAESEKALQYFDVARKLFSEINNSMELGNCDYNSAMVHIDLGRNRTAEKLLLEAIYEFTSAGAVQAAGMAYNSFGALHMRSGHLEKAEFTLQLAQQILTRSNARVRLAENQAAFAELRIRQQQPEAAKRHLTAAIVIFDDLGLAERAASVRKHIASLADPPRE